MVRAVKGLISRAGMVLICPLLWQRDVKLQQQQQQHNNIYSNVEPVILFQVDIFDLN